MNQVNKAMWEVSLPTGYYDEIVYNSKLKQKGLQGFWHHLTFKTVNKNIENSNYNLDYACGPGTFMGMYFKKRAVGYDISKSQINFAQKKYKNDKFIFTTSKDSIKIKGPFKSATMLGLLEFLSEKESIKLINFLYNQLEPGGTLVLTTPNYQITMKLILKLLTFFSAINYSLVTINKIDKSKFVNLIEQTNFKNYEIKKSHNFFIILSIISHNLAEKVSVYFDNFTKNRFGLMLIVKLKK